MMKTIRINEYDFSYEEKGSGPTVLFVHGSASDLRIWNAQMEAFAGKFHVISYSRRFHWPNKQIHGDQDYSMQQHVDDLRMLITRLVEEPVNLVCHSYGALLAIELACYHPELIRKQVLSEPPAIRLFVSNQPKPGELLKLIMSRPRTAFSIIRFGAKGIDPATRAVKQGDNKKALQLFGKAVLGEKAFSGMSEERKEMARINFIAQEFTGSGFLPVPVDRLKTCKISTLLLTGEISPKVFGCLADRLEELLPDVRREVIPGSSHVMQYDNVPAFNAAVYNFLTGLH